MLKTCVWLIAAGCFLASPFPSQAKELVCIIHSENRTIGVFPLPPDGVPHCRHATEAARKEGINADFRIACWGGSVAETELGAANEDDTAVIERCK